MANSEDVLKEIKHLGAKLYGENGFEGDLPEIKNLLKSYDARISKNSKHIYVIVGILSASGLGAGVSQFL